MEKISLGNLILALRKTYLDVNDEYMKLKDYSKIDRDNLKKIYFYFGKDDNGKDNFICSVVDKLSMGAFGKKDIIYKSYSNEYIVVGEHCYRVDITDNEKFREIADEIFSSEFMINRPFIIDVEDKQIVINPSNIEVNEKKPRGMRQELTIFDDKYKNHLVSLHSGYLPIIVYKGIDDYILTSNLYTEDYLSNLMIERYKLNSYYNKIIDNSDGSSFEETKLDKSSEYNIVKNNNNYGLVLRPSNERHID